MGESGIFLFQNIKGEREMALDQTDLWGAKSSPLPQRLKGEPLILPFNGKLAFVAS